MLNYKPSEQGTLVIIALLVLSLVFAGLWINSAVEPGGNPRGLLPWFGGAAVVIILLGFIIYWVQTRSRRPD